VRLRCLIVDDSEEFLVSASRLLGSQGVEVVGCASSSTEALQLAQTLLPSVALVDVELGDEDGLELARELSRRQPSLAVVLVSAHDQEDELSELVAACGASGFLAKTDLGAAALSALVH
jgi:DNA-binding NarL/FixJ family response regulator